MKVAEIQKQLAAHNLDGWLLIDFHGRNDIAVKLLKIEGLLTRKSACFIPVSGEPVVLVNPVEQRKFSHLAAPVIPYRGYQGFEAELKKLLSGCRRVAMEYSPLGRLPYIGIVDAGTLELIRSFGVEVVSSADLVANFGARLLPEQIASHRKAAANLITIKEAAFAQIAERLQAGQPVSEYDVCQFILQKLQAAGMTTEFGPNCSVNAHAGDPHYEPSADSSAPIKNGSLVLIDLLARLVEDSSVYGDITWMAFAGRREEIRPDWQKMFAVVAEARDAAIKYLQKAVGRRSVAGYEVDDACRAVIDEAGFGQYFTHRTGHSITTSEHGEGPNIDNLETEDRRLLQAGHLFSIEPGIYRDDCGFRSEINCLITETGLEVTTLPLQSEITPLW